MDSVPHGLLRIDDDRRAICHRHEGEGVILDVSSNPEIESRPAVTVAPACRSSQLDLERRVFPEVSVSGFAHSDQEVAFFTQVAALLRPTDVVLDFGAGRG